MTKKELQEKINAIILAYTPEEQTKLINKLYGLIIKNTNSQKQKIKKETGNSVLVIEQIRQAFADYRRAEGCSCCRDIENHEEAEKRLAELLKPTPYHDGSGWDWGKYITKG